MERKSIIRTVLKILLAVTVCVTGSSLTSCRWKADPAWIFMDEPLVRFLDHTNDPRRYVDTIATGEVELNLTAVSHWYMKDPEHPYELALLYDIRTLSDEGTLEIHEDEISCSYRGEVLRIRDMEILEESGHRTRGEIYFQHRDEIVIDSSGMQMSQDKTHRITIDLSKAIYYNGVLIPVDTIRAEEYPKKRLSEE